MSINVRSTSLNSILAIFLLFHAAAGITAKAGSTVGENTHVSPYVTLRGNGYDAAEVDAKLAGLSDVQVRQMLQKELKDKAEMTTDILDENVPGPGAWFADLLNSLIRTSTASESRFKRLIANVPQIFPDLYKVFVTL